jgi:hypothetical protein
VRGAGNGDAIALDRLNRLLATINREYRSANDEGPAILSHIKHAVIGGFSSAVDGALLANKGREGKIHQHEIN